MRFSIWPNWMQPWDALAESVLLAERSGWDGAWIADHYMGDGGEFGPADAPTVEATAAIAALGATTARIRLGSLVLAMSHRHPAAIANWAATTDHISAGRLVLGVGAGWQQNEHRQYGFELPAAARRVERLRECCAALNGLLRTPSTTIAGRWIRLDEAVCEPKPVQPRLPLLVGGKGDRMLRVVAEFADEWNMWGLPATITERSGVLESHCAEIGRDAGTIRRSTQAHVLITDDDRIARRFVEEVAPRAAVAGSVAHLTDRVAEWAEAGIDELIVPDMRIGTGRPSAEFYDRFIEEVAPSFR